MDTVQIQKRTDAKLDKIAYLLEELIKIHEEELYPSEDKIKASVLKRLEKKAKNIANGRRKTTKFRTIEELDRIITSYT